MKKLLSLFMMALLATTLTGCFGESKSENALEDAGESIEEAANDSTRAVEDALD